MLAALAQHFGWPPDFWRRKPPPQHSMGWRELKSWIGAMNRQKNGQQPDPYSWHGADSDPGWHELRQQRDRAMGRR